MLSRFVFTIKYSLQLTHSYGILMHRVSVVLSIVVPLLGPLLCVIHPPGFCLMVAFESGRPRCKTRALGYQARDMTGSAQAGIVETDDIQSSWRGKGTSIETENEP